MKTSKLFLIAIIISISACRKDRTCNCTVVEEGTITTRNQTAGLSITVLTLPIQVVAAKDTTMVSPMTANYEKKTLYKGVKPATIKTNCVSSREESLNETSVQTIPGTSTITTTQNGLRRFSCKIE